MLNIDILYKWIQTPIGRQVLASISCYISAMFASISDYWIAPYSKKLTSGEDHILTASEVVSLISTLEISAAIFCIPGAYLADRFGRKRTLLASGILATVVWLITIFTKDIVVLYVARLAQGIVVDTGRIVAPIYLAEISGAKRRGTLGSYYSVFWNLGTLFGFIISDYLSFQMYTLTLIVLPILFGVSFIFVPETPYYYFMKNEPDNARSSLKWLRHGEDIEVEYTQIEEAVQEDMKNKGNWKDLIATKKDRRALLIVQIVTLSKFMVGITAFIAYAEDIFAKAGQHMFTPNQQSICLVLLFTLSTSVSAFYSDTVGRRKLLIYSLIGTAISNIIIAVYFCLLELTSLPVTPYVWLMYFGILGYCIFTTIGPGQLLPVMKTEFFPSHTRSKGGAVTNLFCVVSIYIQLVTFPIISTHIGMYFNFVIFGIVAVIGYIFVKHYIPESAGKTLAEVDQTVKDITSR